MVTKCARIKLKFKLTLPLQKMGLSWEEAEVAALDRHGWRRSVVQCVQLDPG